VPGGAKAGLRGRFLRADPTPGAASGFALRKRMLLDIEFVIWITKSSRAKPTKEFIEVRNAKKRVPKKRRRERRCST
jgi:hypothetical protein